MESKLEFKPKGSKYQILIDGNIIGGINKENKTWIIRNNITPSELRQIANFCEQQTEKMPGSEETTGQRQVKSEGTD